MAEPYRADERFTLYSGEALADDALRAIGTVRWVPGPKPGWRPSLAEALAQSIAARTEEPVRVRDQL